MLSTPVFAAASRAAAQPLASSPAVVPSGAEGDALSVAGTLDCIAAFYPDEAAMRNVARSLLKHHGMKVSNLVLMGPRDAEPVRFARQARRWNGRWSGGHPDAPSLPVFLASLAGLLVLAFTAGWWVLNGDAPLGWLLVGLVVLTCGMGWLGLQLVRPWSEPLRTRRFESSVRRQLSLGAWALVVHEMPRHRQAGAMALLRGASLRWCAVAEPAIRI